MISGMQVETGTLVSADWPALWPMLQDMGTTGGEASVRDRFDELLECPEWALLGARAGGVLVGYAAAQDRGPHLRAGDEHRTARLHDLYVLPARRHHGAGRALMDAVVAWARGRVRYLEWQAHQQRAAPFYQRLGYHGEPCPQPDHPTFEIDLSQPG